MHFIQLIALNLCMLLALNSLVCGQTTRIPKQKAKVRNANALARTANEFDSKIYNINKRPRNLLHRQAAHAATTSPAATTVSPGSKMTKTRNPSKSTHTLNKHLLKTLGFTKIKAPNSHNRKRLAIESRYHSTDDDSHMFIIKLAPNMHYYTNPNAVTAATAVGVGQNLLEQQHEQQTLHNNIYNDNNNNNGDDNNNNKGLTKLTATNSLSGSSGTDENNTNKISSLGFSWNGRLNRIYHWNLPVIKKLLNDKKRFPHLTSAAAKNGLTDIKDVPTWSKPWENEVVEKSFGMNDYRKSLKRKSPSYYAPTNVVNNKSFNKYFAGNGKPKGFYVIKENQVKPVYHKNIIS